MTTPKHELVNRRCDKYAVINGWDYKVIYPKQIPDKILRNIKSLHGALKRRKWFDEWIPIVEMRLRYMGKIAIIDLAKSFSTQISPLFILPVIYHLIAKGIFTTNIYQDIDEYSEISMGSLLEQIDRFVLEEGDNDEAE
ncbi:TnsA endonuclease C-terminal domain-containing protein [Paenibacillus sedimenti]|uniref:TnsA endonuclease C-terminal domain-containing protein n=1 Tax=Paenibacillus sedimenti TaxID=2770274 RepID=A0A926QMZ7_9BACL|nr:TnsA endonuclease C-terminal domain-containing protein [Paenibacillus sedimenti]MBD0383874.1 TnsA endonuclease C-terminal domain-containing protein [Paenibacillus sedimenti]